MISNSGSVVNIIVILQPDGHVRMKRSCRSSPVSWKRMQRIEEALRKTASEAVPMEPSLSLAFIKAQGREKLVKG